MQSTLTRIDHKAALEAAANLAQRQSRAICMNMIDFIDSFYTDEEASDPNITRKVNDGWHKALHDKFPREINGAQVYRRGGGQSSQITIIPMV